MDELFWSLDVVALYPSLPRQETIECCYTLLDNDDDFHKRTVARNCSKTAVKKLLHFCLTNAFLRFNDTFYEQIDGGPMGLGIVGLAANAFMEKFEKSVLHKARIMVGVYKRYADDICTKTTVSDMLKLKDAMNAEHPNISMTHEEEKDGKIGFLDVLIHRNNDNTVDTSVYRKPCHSNQYLQFNSNHPMCHKRSVVRTLIHRAYTHCSTETFLQEELKTAYEVLAQNGYPMPFIKRVHHQYTHPQEKKPTPDPKQYISIPYMKGWSEGLARICASSGIAVRHRALQQNQDPCEDCQGPSSTREVQGQCLCNTMPKLPNRVYW